MENRRKFERLNLPTTSKAFVTSAEGKRLGGLSVLGRGGFQIDLRDNSQFPMGSSHDLVIVDESESIRREVRGLVRMSNPGAVGFEFQDLNPDAAVEMGVIIGKYYSAANNS
ncbi:MAG TPA: PilZ domain-containing protein [Terriglobales bacterium]|nr:PilZ domain-containing protein [Terriglobales bacterium]